jgi:hypothetical protein
MSIFLYILCTLLILVWSVTLWLRNRRLGTFLVAAVAFGLTYDNLILALGNWIGPGNLLYALSLPRFYLHQLVLPWIILASFEQVRWLGHSWAQKPLIRWWMFFASVLVMLLGVLTRLIPLDLQLTSLDGVTRYVDMAAKGPPLVSILSIGFAGVMGWLLWRRNRYIWLFLTAVLVFIGEGIPLEWVRRIIGSGAEVLFMVAMLVMERRIKAGLKTGNMG